MARIRIHPLTQENALEYQAVWSWLGIAILMATHDATVAVVAHQTIKMRDGQRV